jgi:hypothetical protein
MLLVIYLFGCRVSSKHSAPFGLPTKDQARNFVLRYRSVLRPRSLTIPTPVSIPKQQWTAYAHSSRRSVSEYPAMPGFPPLPASVPCNLVAGWANIAPSISRTFYQSFCRFNSNLVEACATGNAACAKFPTADISELCGAYDRGTFSTPPPPPPTAPYFLLLAFLPKPVFFPFHDVQ